MKDLQMELKELICQDGLIVSLVNWCKYYPVWSSFEWGTSKSMLTVTTLNITGLLMSKLVIWMS